MKLNNFQWTSGTTKGTTLGGRVRTETPLKFHNVMAVTTFPFGLEYWTLGKQHDSRIKGAEMRFLWAAAGYRGRDHIKNQRVRPEPTIFNILHKQLNIKHTGIRGGGRP
jgi:hypothetical protein